MVVFLVTVVCPFTVLVVVLTDFVNPNPVPRVGGSSSNPNFDPKPPPPPKPADLKKSSSNIDFPNPKPIPIPFPDPIPLFPFLPKNELKKSSSSLLSKAEFLKNLSNRLSASEKLKPENPPIFGPSQPYASQVFRFSGSERIQYASEISLNFYFAFSISLGFLSGCHFMANFLYAFLISSRLDDFGTPSTSQQSLLFWDIRPTSCNQCQE